MTVDATIPYDVLLRLMQGMRGQGEHPMMQPQTLGPPPSTYPPTLAGHPAPGPTAADDPTGPDADRMLELLRQDSIRRRGGIVVGH